MYNFETMSMTELKAYVMNHRDDKAAWAKYIAQLVHSDPKWYPAPIDREGKEIMNQAFKERFGSPEEF